MKAASFTRTWFSSEAMPLTELNFKKQKKNSTSKVLDIGYQIRREWGFSCWIADIKLHIEDMGSISGVNIGNGLYINIVKLKAVMMF